jgi:hypothetical protein
MIETHIIPCKPDCSKDNNAKFLLLFHISATTTKVMVTPSSFTKLLTSSQIAVAMVQSKKMPHVSSSLQNKQV